MTEGNMTGRPHGGTNEPSDGIPGETSEPGQVDAAPEQSPRAAQGGTVGTEDPSVPGSSGQPRPAEPPPQD
jgi:hypothetical protein